MKNGSISNPSRRKLMKALVSSTAAIAAPFILTPSRAASKQKIVVRDAGGVFSELYADVLYKPFTQTTGIKVVGSAADAHPIAQIRTMVETKRYLWDMAVIGEMAILSLTAGNIYLEKHGLERDPIISTIAPQFMSPYGVGANVYSTVLAYRTNAFKGHRVPQTWEDLWNVNHFPGRRSLRKLPFDTIEEALMADGVPPNSLYPCDLDRAFSNLNKIKPHVAAWWTSGPQAEQLLKSGEVDLMSAFVVRAQSAINAGAPVAFSWDQHIYGYTGWAILKGTPNADACREFIKFASDPKRQARLALHGIGPTQPDVFKIIDQKHAKLLPTYPDNLKRGLYNDASYWFKAQNLAIERFNQWMLS